MNRAFDRWIVLNRLAPKLNSVFVMQIQHRSVFRPKLSLIWRYACTEEQRNLSFKTDRIALVECEKQKSRFLLTEVRLETGLEHKTSWWPNFYWREFYFGHQYAKRLIAIKWIGTTLCILTFHVGGLSVSPYSPMSSGSRLLMASWVRVSVFGPGPCLCNLFFENTN